MTYQQKFQRITDEQAEWIKKNIKETAFKGKYFNNALTFILDKTGREYQLIFTIKEENEKKYLAFHKSFTNKDTLTETREVARPKKLIEELMSHYPPHRNIYERECIKANADKLEKELSSKDTVKPKRIKV